MPDAVATFEDLPTNVPGLDTGQGIEGVAFQTSVYYDAINFFTNSGKLKKVQSGLKWFTLTKNRPFREFKLFIHPKNKFMNPFSFMGCLINVPPVATFEQSAVAADTTNVNHVRVDIQTRYLEWNGEFNMKRI